MRYLVLTDIHANLEALEACLADAAARGYDRALVLGDLVGYCADPNAVDRAHAGARSRRDRPRQPRQGGLRPRAGRRLQRRGEARRALDARHADAGEPRVARRAAARAGRRGRRWWRSATARRSTKTRTSSTSSTPCGRSRRRSGRSACSATRTGPSRSSWRTAAWTPSARPTRSPTALTLQAGSKYLLNPGSVGQPRDGDPRAAYALVDTAAKRVELFRVDYPIETTQAKMIEGRPARRAGAAARGGTIDRSAGLQACRRRLPEAVRTTCRCAARAPSLPAAAVRRRTRRERRAIRESIRSRRPASRTDGMKMK